jgi:phospholipase A1
MVVCRDWLSEALLNVCLRKYRNTLLLCNAVLSILLCAAPVRPVYAGSEILLQCAQQYPGDDAERLKCYDQLAVPASPLGPVLRENIIPGGDAEATTSLVAPTRSSERSYLTRVWNLDDLSNPDPSKLGRLHPYRQNYLIVKKTSSPNYLPSSPLPDHNVTTPLDLDAVEVKFQLSVKADIGDQRNVDFLGIRTFRLWGAYTQQSFWQVFNIRNSSPFRETVYEPELIATLGTGQPSGLKLINLGWVHQSNGRPLPESRSWNRIYLLGGMEWNDITSIMLRGWWRIPEDPQKDDNPDISDYLGRADLVMRWEPRDKSQAVAMLLRNNLSRTDNRGYVQIDWATLVRFGSAARMHIQITSGFGESLIDYNHRQNTFGLGFSFREW